jgi:hypothetical protein
VGNPNWGRIEGVTSLHKISIALFNIIHVSILVFFLHLIIVTIIKNPVSGNRLVGP